MRVESCERRGKLSNPIDSRLRAPLELFDFLSDQCTKAKRGPRGIFIEGILWHWSKKNGHKGSAYDIDALKEFLNKRAAEKKREVHKLVEEVLLKWAKKKGFKLTEPKE